MPCEWREIRMTGRDLWVAQPFGLPKINVKTNGFEASSRASRGQRQSDISEPKCQLSHSSAASLNRILRGMNAPAITPSDAVSRIAAAAIWPRQETTEPPKG